MTNPLPAAAAAVLMLAAAGAAGATAAELPIFEKRGFPLTLHQLQVLHPAEVKEWSPTATLVLRGMPASPHQLAVLAPRRD